MSFYHHFVSVDSRLLTFHILILSFDTTGSYVSTWQKVFKVLYKNTGILVSVCSIWENAFSSDNVWLTYLILLQKHLYGAVNLCLSL